MCGAVRCLNGSNHAPTPSITPLFVDSGKNSAPERVVSSTALATFNRFAGAWASPGGSFSILKSNQIGDLCARTAVLRVRLTSSRRVAVGGVVVFVVVVVGVVVQTASIYIQLR